MKNLTKLVLAFAVCLAAPLATLFAGSYYDSVQASSSGNPYPGNRSGEITAPAGAEVDWEAYASASGSGWAYAYLDTQGIIGITASASSNGQTNDGGYAFFPQGGGTLYYYLTAQAQGGWDSYSGAYSGAMIVAGW